MAAVGGLPFVRVAELCRVANNAAFAIECLVHLKERDLSGQQLALLHDYIRDLREAVADVESLPPF